MGNHTVELRLEVKLESPHYHARDLVKQSDEWNSIEIPEKFLIISTH